MSDILDKIEDELMSIVVDKIGAAASTVASTIADFMLGRPRSAVAEAGASAATIGCGRSRRIGPRCCA